MAVTISLLTDVGEDVLDGELDESRRHVLGQEVAVVADEIRDHASDIGGSLPQRWRTISVPATPSLSTYATYHRRARVSVESL